MTLAERLIDKLVFEAISSSEVRSLDATARRLSGKWSPTNSWKARWRFPTERELDKFQDALDDRFPDKYIVDPETDRSGIYGNVDYA